MVHRRVGYGVAVGYRFAVGAFLGLAACSPKAESSSTQQTSSDGPDAALSDAESESTGAPTEALPSASLQEMNTPGSSSETDAPDTTTPDTAPPETAQTANDQPPPSMNIPVPIDGGDTMRGSVELEVYQDAAAPRDTLDAGVVAPAATEPLVRARFDAPQSDEPQLFGDVVASLDDVDGDGWADFVASSSLETVLLDGGSYQGRVRVYSGFDGRELYELENPDPQPQEPDMLFGHALLGLGDLDGDGIGETAVGARRYDSESGGDAGRVYIYSGAEGALLRAIDAPAGVRWFGNELQLAEDADGDEIAEMLVAAPLGDAAYLVSPVTGAVLMTFASPMPREAFFGASIAYLGDTDADGRGDVAIGDYTIADPPEAGRVQVISGTGSLLATIDAPDDTRVGFGVAAVGDVNGDGAADLAIDREAGVDVVSGAAPDETLYSIPSEAFFFGERMLALPDQDCDGIADLAIAARDWSDMGGVFIYSGASGAQLFVLSVPELPPQARFGRHLAVLKHPEPAHGSELLIGATGVNDNHGAVFTFALLGPASCPDGVPDAADTTLP